MKFVYSILIILIILVKTGNVLSEDSVFTVNNIDLIKKTNISNDELANIAIKKGYSKLLDKILLKGDYESLSNLNISQIKQLVSHYQVISENDQDIEGDKIFFNIFFDKEKFHNLLYEKSISYSEITNKDIYLLPILKKKDEINVYNKNFFYKNWNDINKNELIDFILPLENIEVIRNINLKKESLISINLENLFKEYSNENLALVIIDESKNEGSKIFLKTRILKKNIDKSFFIKRNNLNETEYYNKMINSISNEIINLVKSQNLIDVKTPSFINAKFQNIRNNNLAELNNRLEKIDLVDRIFVQEINKDFTTIKLKYFGKLDKIMKRLGEQKISLKLEREEWSIKIEE